MPTIQEIMDKKKALQAELTEFGKAALSDEFKKVFDAHPTLMGIMWRQYTPYFNDGEPCTFRVNDFDIKRTDTPADASGGYGDEGWEYLSSYSRDANPPPRAMAGAVEALARIDGEIYEAVFGDHCSVIATREGFTVEECEHD